MISLCSLKMKMVTAPFIDQENVTNGNPRKFAFSTEKREVVSGEESRVEIANSDILYTLIQTNPNFQRRWKPKNAPIIHLRPVLKK